MILLALREAVAETLLTTSAGSVDPVEHGDGVTPHLDADLAEKALMNSLKLLK